MLYGPQCMAYFRGICFANMGGGGSELFSLASPLVYAYLTTLRSGSKGAVRLPGATWNRSRFPWNLRPVIFESLSIHAQSHRPWKMCLIAVTFAGLTIVLETCNYSHRKICLERRSKNTVRVAVTDRTCPEIFRQ